jgi:hypothetical protein
MDFVCGPHGIIALLQICEIRVVTVRFFMHAELTVFHNFKILTVAPMWGIYLHLKSVLHCIRLFYIKKKKINDDAFHVLNFHFSLTVALRLSFFFSKYKISV